MRKALLLVSLMLTMVFAGFAQERSISGVIKDASGEALPGVTVVVKGTTQGTVTNIDGKYRLMVTGDNPTLQYRLIGYKTQEVIVGSQSEITIALEEDVEQLDEVVVTALGVERDERSLGYSVQNVSGEEMSEVKSANMVDGLGGKIAGVQVSSSGAMGGSSRIVIRGVNSVSGNNQPLFVVDGVPIDNSNFTSSNQSRGAGGYDYGNAAQDINPDDIETMSVLKGASAAALYGSRAANGVVMITTKSGKGAKSNKIGVSVNAGVSFESVLKLPDYQNGYGGGGGGAFPGGTDANGIPYAAYAVDESWGPALDGTLARQWYSFDEWHPDYGKGTPWVAHPNNVKDFFDTGVTSNIGVSLTGNTEKSSFRLSYTNYDIKGVFPNSEMQRDNFSLNATQKLTDKLKVNVGANYVGSKALGRPGTGYDGNNVMQQFNQWGQRQWDDAQMKQYKNPDGSQRTWNRKSASDPAPKYSDNPYWVRNENYQDDDRNRFYGNVGLNYQFNGGFSASAKVMTDYYTDYRRERIAVGSQAISEYSEDVRSVQETNYEAMLRYDKTFTNELSLNAFVGGNIRTNKYRRNYQGTSNGLSVPNLYTTSNSNGPVQTVDSGTDKQVNSVFGSASLGYRNTFFVDASLRADQSSTLPANNNTYLYPAVSGSVVFTELGSLADSKVISFGKVRLGWAQVGNDTDPYSVNQTYSADSRGAFNGNPIYYVPNTLNNSNIKPEQTTSLELGLDMRFFNDRLGFDATIYKNVSTDQIIDVPTSGSTGYTRQIINAGEMLNQGVELSINATPILTESGFRWDLGFNYAKNYNELVKLADGLDNLRLANAPFAVSVNATEGQSYGQIRGTGYQRNDNGDLLVGAGGTYLPTDELVNLGSSLADWTGGLSNTFTYKGISLRVLLDMRFGGKLFSTTNMWGNYSGIMAETVANNIREDGIIVPGVKEDGTTNDVVIDANTHFYANGGYIIAEANMYDASYVKLKELALTYRIPSNITKKIGAYGASFSVTGRNLWILHSNVPHIDPEFANNSGNVQGIEGGAVPTTKSWGFNLKLDF
ncbi:SusC/RagA family TonB-linked outer membrane protein [Flammeovirga pectinis]|uniref:SusC/RagA family TonB-linked outer membrane protein n=1 Tax=Flammeovirga pectinis TaxID=2494373 RepID=A0A3Q9FPS5_9BACT|nr:SusC/RagA family TonB-linked outer membrane protein [Flammeovirga pectinis]AZQ64347.1 SusC/RagA family TonB-linked outer membrane protein [Flammeovirga pectinis]